jgi:cytochrome c556
MGVAIAVLAASPVLAATAADVIKARIDGYRKLGAAYKKVNDELKAGSPQIQVLQASAVEIRNTSRQLVNWFPAGTGPGSGAKTAAKPEIWTKAGEFRAAQAAFVKQADAFYQAAASKDVNRISAQAKVLGQSCSTCHRAFRAQSKS